MLKRKRERQVGGGVNEMGANEMGANEMGANEMGDWCPSEMACTMQRLILLRYFAGEAADRCTICLDAMVPKMILYLPCKHAFHYTCWQHLVEQQTYTCPLCRTNFSAFLPVVGIETTTVTNTTAVLTIFTHMDLYDFMLELLWRNYEREADLLNEEDIWDDI
jgi:hypothetical protein